MKEIYQWQHNGQDPSSPFAQCTIVATAAYVLGTGASELGRNGSGTRSIYCGKAGYVSVKLVGEGSYKLLPLGQGYNRICAVEVRSTGCTATSVVAYW